MRRILTICFLLAGNCAPGEENALVRRVAITVDWSGTAPELEKLTAFCGEKLEIHWVVGPGDGDAFFTDVFRVLSTTVAPLEKERKLEAPTTIGKTDSRFVSHALDIPGSDAPQNYLIKLSDQRGDRRTVICVVSIRAVPTSLVGRKLGWVSTAEKSAISDGFVEAGAEIVRYEEYDQATAEKVVIVESGKEEDTDRILDAAGRPEVTIILIPDSPLEPDQPVAVHRFGKKRVIVMNRRTFSSQSPEAIDMISNLFAPDTAQK